MIVVGTLCVGLSWIGSMFSEGGGNPGGFLVYAAVAFVLGIVLLSWAAAPPGEGRGLLRRDADRAVRTRLLVGLGLALVAADCSSPAPTPTPPPAETPAPTDVGGIHVILPTHTLTGAMPAAEITGKLVYAIPCVTISDLTNVYVPVWPPGFSARLNGQQVLIVSPRGEVFGASGEISLTGGVFEGESASQVRDHAVNLAPPCDKEPFWLVAYVQP